MSINGLGSGIRKYVFVLALKGLLSTFVFMAVINVTYGFYVQKIDRALRLQQFNMLDRVLQNQFGDVPDYIDLVKLNALLKEFTQTNIINAYRITLNDQIYSYVLIDRMNTVFDQKWPKSRSIASIGPIPIKTSVENPMDFEKATFKFFNFLTEEQNIRVLVTFIKPNPWDVYFRELKFQALPMSFMFFGIFITLLLFIIYARKEFVLIFQNLSKIQAGNLNQVNTYTPEGQGLRNFATTMTTQVQDLKSAHQHIVEQILPGKLWVTELYKSGISHFEGTLIRMDLNGYTSKRNALGDDLEKKRFFEAEFRQWGDAICAKFGALVYEFIGDEFVVLVEDQKEWNHRLAALQLVRAVFEDVFVLNRKFKSLHLPPISIKASMVSGILNLKKERSHISLDSEPLILSQRLLSNIKEKEESQVILFQEDAHELLNHATFFKAQPVVFKLDDNYPKRNAKKIKHILGWKDYKTKDQLIAHLKYLRSENDLIQSVNFISKQNLEQADEFWDLLLRIKYESPSQEFLTAFEHLFENMCHLKSETPHGYERSLSKAIALSRLLYPFYKNPKNLHNLLVSLADSSYPRVVANARETLFEQAPQQVDLMHFIHSSNHRAAIDSLIDLAKKEGVTDFVINQLKNWITGNRPEFQLSSLYAVFEISFYFKQKQPEYFVTNEGFTHLAQLIDQATSIQNPLSQKWIRRYKEEIST